MRKTISAHSIRRAFTLTELLIVIAIVLLVSALGLGLILGLLVGRAVRDASRVLQGALYGARDMAMTANQPRGLAFFGVDVDGDGSFNTGLDVNGDGDYGDWTTSPVFLDDDGDIRDIPFDEERRNIYFVYEDFVTTPTGTKRVVRPVPNVDPVKLPPKVWVQLIRDVSQILQYDTLTAQMAPPVIWFNEQGQAEDAPALYHFLIQSQQEARGISPEDRNKNGVLDLGEDTNGNGILDRLSLDAIIVTLYTRTGVVQVADLDPNSPSNIYRYAQEGAATTVK